MFDFRYHAISLVAVLLALGIGLLLGVAIGDEGLVSSAERDIRSSLRSDVRDARAEAASVRDELEAQERFDREAYPVMVGGRLENLRVALVSLGGVSDELVDDVRGAVQPAGARLESVSVVREPIDLQAIARRAGGTRFDVLADPELPEEERLELLERLGRRVGAGIVLGSRLAGQVRGAVFSASSGPLEGVEGVVLTRTPSELEEEDQARVDAFERGLLGGLSRPGIPVVGAEQTSTDPSQIEWFQERALTSVDNVDEVAGRLALVLTLAGAEGAYGVKSTADALIPKAPTVLR